MKTQVRIVLVIGALLVLLCALFPNWRSVGWGINGELSVSFDVAAGRAFVFSGPSELDKNVPVGGRRSLRIDGGALLAEVLIITSIALLVFTCVSPSIPVETRSEE